MGSVQSTRPATAHADLTSSTVGGGLNYATHADSSVPVRREHDLPSQCMPADGLNMIRNLFLVNGTTVYNDSHARNLRIAEGGGRASQEDGSREYRRAMATISGAIAQLEANIADNEVKCDLLKAKIIERIKDLRSCDVKSDGLLRRLVHQEKSAREQLQLTHTALLGFDKQLASTRNMWNHDVTGKLLHKVNQSLPASADTATAAKNIGKTIAEFDTNQRELTLANDTLSTKIEAAHAANPSTLTDEAYAEELNHILGSLDEDEYEDQPTMDVNEADEEEHQPVSYDMRDAEPAHTPLTMPNAPFTSMPRTSKAASPADSGLVSAAQ